MENTFYVTGCRFHTKEKNKLLIIGYFRNNEMGDNRLSVVLDKDQLTYTLEKRRLTAPCVKEVNGKKITKEYFLWVQLPETWKKYKQLRIFNYYREEKKLVISIRNEKLLRSEQQIPKSIDTTTVCKDGIKIRGWFLEEEGLNLSFWDMEGNPLFPEVKYENRPDVMREYPEVSCEDIVGFSAIYKGQIPKKIRVSFQTPNKETDEIVKLIETPAEKKVAYIQEMVSKAMVYYRQFGIKATMKRVAEKLTEERSVTEYEEWMKRHQPSKEALKKQRNHQFSYNPKISIVVAAEKVSKKLLQEMNKSLQRQTYSNWELCQAESMDKAFEMCTGDYIAFVEPGDLLTPDALYECVYAINREPKTEIIYSDEDTMNIGGTEYFAPHFKSDFNIDMLRSTNYFGHLLVIKKSLCEKVGTWNTEYDFILRCVEKTSHIRHIAKVLYHKRMNSDFTVETKGGQTSLEKAEIDALKAHYARVGVKATVVPTNYSGIYRSKYELEEKPLVSVIIPNKDHIDDLDKCIRSLEEVNSYSNIECIIVENNSQEEKTFAYYQELEKRNDKCKVVYWSGKGFNYPAINEFGLQHAKGEYILLLNNDTEILNPECIEEMLGYCMREDVGAVGARLFYEDGTIQHAGVIVGLGGVAGHAFVAEAQDSPGYFGRAVMAQDLSAVTAACMMIKGSVYKEVGGLDASFAVAFNDVDLCMKIRKAGYLIVYNPHAQLMHYESKSRGYDDTEEKIRRFASEIQLFQTRWGEFLEAGDPYYNPNLTLNRHDFALR